MKFFTTIIFISLNSTLFAQLLKDCELDSIDGMKVQIIVEKPPAYEGGLKKFHKDFSENVKFPRVDSTSISSSRYYVSFVVDTSGNIRNFCASPNMDFLVNKSIFIEKLNKWSPGTHRNKIVPVRMMLPINIHYDW